MLGFIEREKKREGTALMREELCEALNVWILMDRYARFHSGGCDQITREIGVG